MSWWITKETMNYILVIGLRFLMSNMIDFNAFNIILIVLYIHVKSSIIQGKKLMIYWFSVLYREKIAIMTSHVRTFFIFMNNEIWMNEWVALTRPPLFKCKIIIKVWRKLGAKHQIRFAFIWGETFSDLLSFGAQNFLISLHLGRAFLPKAFLYDLLTFSMK